MENQKLLNKIDELNKKIAELEIRIECKTMKPEKRSSRLHVIAGLFISIFLASTFLYAAQVLFTDGDLISADQVNSNFTELYTRMAALEDDVSGSGGVNERVSDLETTFSGVSRIGYIIRFSGVNVQIVSGTGGTDGAVNGRGNLFVGYNEARATGSYKTGSHNIVIGPEHNYQSFGGIVAGFHNTISFDYASVTGGSNNTASGNCASVSGGYVNTASGTNSSVSGGGSNQATFTNSSVNGGFSNTASGNCSSVSGGASRLATGTSDWVAGALFQEE